MARYATLLVALATGGPAGIMRGMTAQQRYMLDVFGFLKIERALSDLELSDAQAAADRYITLAQQAPEVRSPVAARCTRLHTPADACTRHVAVTASRSSNPVGRLLGRAIAVAPIQSRPDGLLNVAIRELECGFDKLIGADPSTS